MTKTKAFIKEQKSMFGRLLRGTTPDKKAEIQLYLLIIETLRKVEASIAQDEMEAAYIPGPIEIDVPVLMPHSEGKPGQVLAKEGSELVWRDMTLEELDYAHKKSQEGGFE